MVDPGVSERRHSNPRTMKKPDEYTVRLILEWDCEEPAPGHTSRLEDARRLERLFKAERQATKLDVFRNIRVYDDQITANTTLANIDNRYSHAAHQNAYDSTPLTPRNDAGVETNLPKPFSRVLGRVDFTKLLICPRIQD